jgi:hypothetical protein
VTAYTCLVCGNSAVQKVTAICQAGSWASNSQGVSFGVGHVGPLTGGADFGMVSTTTSQSAGASHLARTLAPPLRPVCRSPGGTAGLVILICVAAFFGLFGVVGLAALANSGPSDSGGLGCAVFMLIVALASAGGAVAIHLDMQRQRTRAMVEYRHKLPLWEAGMRRWNQLFYCSRCDNVYNPQTGQSAPAHAMPSILWDDTTGAP